MYEVKSYKFWVEIAEAALEQILYDALCDEHRCHCKDPCCPDDDVTWCVIEERESGQCSCHA